MTLGFAVDATGACGPGPLVLPSSPGLVGARLYTQCVVIDPRGPMQFSNGLETVIGGS